MKKVLFDEIHTLEKQKFLKEKMQQVSNEIHSKFTKLEKVNNCPVCQSKSIHQYTECFGYEMDICDECNHIFTNPFPSYEALDYYYNSDLKDFENKFFMDSFENRIPIFDRRILEIEKYLGRDSQLLDVGSAIGIFIEALFRKNNPFKVTACDLNQKACLYLQDTYKGLEVLNENIYSLSKPDSYFDGISLWDTVEHLTDPDRFLIKIKDLLKPGGYFFFSTPNTFSFEWGVMETDHVQLLPPGHVNLYNSKNIKIILEKTGFQVVDIQTLNASLDISYILKNYIKDSYSPLEKFILNRLKDDSIFFESFNDYLVQTKSAGNMLVIARKE
ncbi:class I SAM-dependent methyltransferase [Leptospira sp. GIMC2001]|uniref:class I SAM-dependent methyltransferase n=1 Tax=Leptospira sp. GIMC2001 TaxID=1513297 RepID=UPI00234A5570|nr:class I SAM-dependent methyltransferase [Leptospira sp. GIMC2001]WCL51216.1 class I SAM-dependent methyltransferase [Leptospira sp. GIMC2001]